MVSKELQYGYSKGNLAEIFFLFQQHWVPGNPPPAVLLHSLCRTIQAVLRLVYKKARRFSAGFFVLCGMRCRRTLWGYCIVLNFLCR